MPFRVKKRPNALQSLVAGIGEGFGAGVQAGAKSYQEKLMDDLLNKSDKAKKFQTTRTSTINDLKGRIGDIVDPEVKSNLQLIMQKMYNATDETSLSEHVGAFNDYINVQAEKKGTGLYHKKEEEDRTSYEDVHGRRRYVDDGSLVFPEVKDKPKGNKKTFSKPYGMIEYDLTTGGIKIIPIEGTLNPADTRQMNIDVADRKRLLGIKNGVDALGKPLEWSEEQQKQLSAIEGRLSSPPYNLKIGDLKDIDSTVKKEESSKGKSESGEVVEEPTLKWEEAGIPPALWNHPKLAGKKDQGFIDIWTKATESERKEVLKSFGLSEPEEEVVEEVEEEEVEEEESAQYDPPQTEGLFASPYYANKEGHSPVIKAFGTEGYFDFNEEPLKGDMGSNMYLFVNKDGESHHRYLDKDLAGGRWEMSGQKEEYDAYNKNPALIKEHWGDGEVGKRIAKAVEEGKTWEELPAYLADLDTWRSISPDRNLDEEIDHLEDKGRGRDEWQAEASSQTPEFKKIQKSILLHEEKYFSGEYEKVAKEEWDSKPKQVKEVYNNSFTKYLNDRQMQRMQAWDNEYQKEYGTFDNFLLNKTKEKTKESEEKETEKSKPRKVTAKSLVDKYGEYLVKSMTDKIQEKPYPKGKLLEKVAEALEGGQAMFKKEVEKGESKSKLTSFKTDMTVKALNEKYGKPLVEKMTIKLDEQGYEGQELIRELVKSLSKKKPEEERSPEEIKKVRSKLESGNHKIENVLDTDGSVLKNHIGDSVKLAKPVVKIIQSVNIEMNSKLNKKIDIMDSYRSHETQKKSYDKWVEGGKKGAFTAHPDTSFHTIGFAFDLAQTNEMKDEKVFKILREAGLIQHPAEWWHWSLESV